LQAERNAYAKNKLWPELATTHLFSWRTRRDPNA
jgi:hypothetical protein